MINLALTASSGVITWLAPPSTIAAHAASARRETTSITAMIPCFPVHSRDQALVLAERFLSHHLTAPHYERMLTSAAPASTPAGDSSTLADLVLDNVVAWGDTDQISERISEYVTAGATEVTLALYGGAGTPPAFFRRSLNAARAAINHVTATASPTGRKDPHAIAIV